MATGRIVVGVDGSEQSVRALQWAATQAGLTGAELDVVTAWEFPTWGGLIPENATYDPEKQAAHILAATVNKALAVHAATSATCHTVKGNAAEALLNRSKGADLLVIGARGHTGLRATVMGSVSLHVVQHSSVPVTVVRGTEPGQLGAQPQASASATTTASPSASASGG
ncbi:universal stress protein [Streptomyces sp. NPDC048442]|uniref:universal stress protein n=1 Tax=Streptomyces sp. NPDC048442 TaxID=3154823 RepID=UPI003435FBFF